MIYHAEQLHRELIAANVPVMAASEDGRIAFALPHKTSLGQWAMDDGGPLEWVGPNPEAPKPTDAHLATIAATKAAHVPEPEPLPLPSLRLVLRAMVRQQRSLVLTGEEQAALEAIVA